MMKKTIMMMLAAVLVLSMAAGCGANTTGSVTTDGSTSMEKVIGVLGEAFQNDTGSVRYGGSDIFAKDVDVNQLRKEIGMVFQKPNPFPMSIYDNIFSWPMDKRTEDYITGRFG